MQTSLICTGVIFIENNQSFSIGLTISPFWYWRLSFRQSPIENVCFCCQCGLTRHCSKSGYIGGWCLVETRLRLPLCPIIYYQNSLLLVIGAVTAPYSRRYHHIIDLLWRPYAPAHYCPSKSTFFLRHQRCYPCMDRDISPEIYEL